MEKKKRRKGRRPIRDIKETRKKTAKILTSIRNKKENSKKFNINNIDTKSIKQRK